MTSDPRPMTALAADGERRGPSCRTLGLGIAALLLVLDQASKWWIVEVVMQPPRTIELAPFLNIVMTWNRGVSFGLFDNGWSWAPLGFVALALVVVALLLVWLWRTASRLQALGIGMIVGGALGNVVDRLRYGAVADFLDFHAAGFHWPAFNVADAAITVGVALMLLDSLFMGRQSPIK